MTIDSAIREYAAIGLDVIQSTSILTAHRQLPIASESSGQDFAAEFVTLFDFARDLVCCDEADLRARR